MNPVITICGTECCVMKCQLEEMRMLSWTSVHTRQGRIRNECIREKVRLVPIVGKKMVECHLR